MKLQTPTSDFGVYMGRSFCATHLLRSKSSRGPSTLVLPSLTSRVYLVGSDDVHFPSSMVSFLPQEGGDASVQGSWVVVLAGPGGLDETRCIASEDVQDPTEISSADWMCKSSLANGRELTLWTMFYYTL